MIGKSPVKAAVIGTGRIGMSLELDPKRIKPASHVGMWIDHPDAVLAAVCDSDEVKLRQAKEMAPETETYTDPATLLSEVRPDIVSIATWRDTHYDMMDLAIDHGVSVIICEKPISERVDHAQQIVDKAKEKGVHLLINHRRRFDPLLDQLRQEIREGVYGEMLQVTSAYVYGLMTTGTHLIDALRHLLIDSDGEIVWVSGHLNERESFAPDDDPCVDGFVGFESGLKAGIQSLNMKDYDIFDFRLFGRKAMVHFYDIGRNIDIYPVETSPEHEGFTELTRVPSERRGGEPRNLFRFLADNAIGCLNGTEVSRSTGYDSLQALKILIAMQESMRDGGRVVKVT